MRVGSPNQPCSSVLSDVDLRYGSKYITYSIQVLHSVHACALVEWHTASGVVGRGDRVESSVVRSIAVPGVCRVVAGTSWIKGSRPVSVCQVKV